MKDLNDLRQARGAAADAMEAELNSLNELYDAGAGDQDEAAYDAAVAEATISFNNAEIAFNKANEKVVRAERVDVAKAKAARGGEGVASGGKQFAPAAVKDPKDEAIEVGFVVAAMAATKGDPERAARRLEAAGHSAPAAILSGQSDEMGGITIPEPLAEKVIDLLRPKVAVRKAGAQSSPIPAGKMRHARLASGATASYSGEAQRIEESAPEFDNIDQSFKKLTALVGLSNDLIRQSSAAVARIARNDLVRQMAAREDIAFIRNDGTGGTPKGLRHWVQSGFWGTTTSKVALSVAAFLRRRVDLVEDSDVPMSSCGWIMRATVKNFLADLRDANGNFLFPSIDKNMTLLGYPIFTTSQIPNNLGDGEDTEIYFGDFAEAMIGDAMTLQIATSDQTSVVDAGGNVKSAFQNDLTFMRAITEHDFALMHDPAFSGGTVTGWSLG